MNLNINQTLPHSPDAEKTVLGAILIDNRLMSEALERLQSEDFYVTSHQRIFEAMTSLFQKNQKIDTVTIAEDLRNKSLIEQVGGVPFITNLTFGLPHFNNLAIYAESVKAKSRARKLLKTCGQTIENVFASNGDFDTVLDEAEQGIYELRQSEENHLQEFSTLLENSMNQLKERIHPDWKPDVLATGFRDLDAKIFGFGKTDLVILGGRPSQGKSTLGLNIVNNVTKDKNKVVAFFSLEMSKEQLVNKMVCSNAGVSYTRFRNGTVTENELRLIQEAFADLYQKQIIIDESSKLTPLQLKARARRIKQRKGRLDLIVADYMQMMNGNGRFQNRENEVAQVSKDLKGIAKDLRCPLLAICSLNRASETRADKKPTMADLRESGQIESDADIILFIHRPAMYAKDENEKQALIGQAEILIAKNREGETGFEKLGFDGSKSSFLELYYGG